MIMTTIWVIDDDDDDVPIMTTTTTTSCPSDLCTLSSTPDSRWQDWQRRKQCQRPPGDERRRSVSPASAANAPPSAATASVPRRHMRFRNTSQEDHQKTM